MIEITVNGETIKFDEDGLYVEWHKQDGIVDCGQYSSVSDLLLDLADIFNNHKKQ